MRVTRKPQFTKTKKLLSKGWGKWVTLKTRDGGGREGVCFFKDITKFEVN